MALVSTDPTAAVDALVALQTAIAPLFSSDSETLDDIPTSSLPFLLLEHHLAMALVNAKPTNTNDMAEGRLANLQRACTLWSVGWWRRLEDMEALTAEDVKSYHAVLEQQEHSDEDNNSRRSMLLAAPDRNAKLERHRKLQQVTAEQARLQSLRQRRSRLGITDTEAMDGFDDAESLERSLAMTQLELAKTTSLEEWQSTLRELPLLEHMIARQKSSPQQQSRSDQDSRRRQQQKQRPMQVTHIAKDGTTSTGPLLANPNHRLQQRETLQSQVLRPGWNQPTMSLDELAEREVRDALEREQRQRDAPTDGPRRYDQLVKDGLEDDEGLVEASAPLDRAWDDFKDANPRGCGNKRGDVGDRNF